MATDALSEVLTHWGFSFDANRLSMITGKIARTDKVLNRTAHNVDIFQQRMGTFFTRAKQLVGAYLGFRAVRSITTDFAQLADATGKTAEGLGIATAEYSALGFVAQSGGLEITLLGNAMGKLSRRAAEAAKGSKENKKTDPRYDS